jgi:hypothetical protein
MENKFCLIGNSHTAQFDNPNLNILYGYGSSICGLYNNNSTLKLKEKILQYQEVNPEKHLVFFLGQSDVEFIYYYKSIKNNNKMDINTFIDEIVVNYVQFIINYIKKPIILGINPTTTQNNEHIFNVNFREQNNTNPSGTYLLNLQYEDVKHFYDNFELRFNNNLLFNKKLKAECEKNNIIYVDLNDEVIDRDMMKVKDIYQPKQDDHHLNKNIRLYHTLIHKIKDFIF